MAGKVGEVDVEAKTWGEGHSVQAGAIRLALAKALTSFIDGDTVDKMRIGLWCWITCDVLAAVVVVESV